MTNAKEIVQGYQAKLAEGDWAGARKFMADDLDFVGPFESFHQPEPFLESLKRVHDSVERVDPKHFFVDGDDVCFLYEMVTSTPAATTFICEWYRVGGGKIRSIRVVFDPRPFAAMFNR